MKNVYLIFIAFCLFAKNVSAQNSFFLASDKSRGDITKGASRANGYLDYSEISSSQLGFSEEPSTGGPAGPKPGQPVFDKITITKNADIATTKLIEYITNGKALRDVEIVTTALDKNGALQPTYKIELKEVLITKISTSSSGDCACYSESYEMAYGAIKITTYSVDKTGKSVENPVKFMWNIAKKTAEF